MEELVDLLTKQTGLNRHLIEILLYQMVAMERKYCEQRGIVRELASEKAISPSQIILLSASMDDPVWF